MVVLSGPSGCGKSSIAKRLLEDPGYCFSVSATTRQPRAGEVDGRDYHFLSREQFREKVRQGAFLEHAEVHGNMYGTLREPVDEQVAAGIHVLLDIDVQGALQLKAQGVPGLYLFIAPPSFEELRRRLVGRGTDAPEVIERRLQKAEDEYRERVKYDHVVTNDDLDRAVAEVRDLIAASADAGGEA
jgi:guanylate kinase